MDKAEIRAIVAAEKAAALGSSTSSDLVTQRTEALDYYLGDMTEHMPTGEGQSKAVSSDVSDTIESVLPSLMDIFTSGDDYCEFSPEGPEDEEAARQETDYINHVFMNENEGFLVLYTMIKDALLSKNGIVKAWWQKEERVEKETYKGLDEASYSYIASDPEIEIVQQTINQTEYGSTYDVVVTKKQDYSCAKVMAVPPEEFGIAKRARSIPTTPYCYHKYQKTPSELIALGFDRTKVENLPSGVSPDEEEDEARNTVEDDFGQSVNKHMRLIDVTEHYIRLDADGDGVAELLKVVTAGGSEELLDVEEIDRMPFHSITPYPMPHRFFGRSIADLVMDIQRIKTHMLRALLDNASLLNNQRIAIGNMGADENTIDDLLTNRPGGIVRMNDVSQLREIPNQQLGSHLLPMIEYVDQSRETRTGVTRHGQGLDPDTLNKASGTATGFQGLMEASQMRIKLIARIFAETGIKSLFLGIHELVKKHQDKAKTVRLRNKWVEVDPRNWKTRNDMTVTVALGSGSKQQQLLFLNQILERQVQALQFQGGAAGPLVTLENVYNTLKRMVEMTGIKGADLYFTEPDMQQLEQQEPPPDPEVMKVQAEAQAEQMRLQLEQQKAQADIQIQREKNAAQMEMEREKSAVQAQLAREKAQFEAALAEQKMVFEQDLAQRQMAFQQQIAAQKATVDAEVKMKKNRPGGDLDK